MTYGTKLRNIRLQKGLSQAEVANAIGLDQSTYSRIESDQSELKARILMKLAKFYEVDINALYPPLNSYKVLNINYLYANFTLLFTVFDEHCFRLLVLLQSKTFDTQKKVFYLQILPFPTFFYFGIIEF